MRLILILLMCLLLVFSVSAQNEFYSSKELTIQTISKGEVSINKLPDDVVQLLRADVSFYPQNTYRQDIMKQNFFPEPSLQGDHVVFEWEYPTSNVLEFEINNVVRTKALYDYVKEKVDFPNQDYPVAVHKYTKPTENIDSDDEDIKAIASSLVEGEDDFFVVVHKIGNWVKENVEYDLSTINLEATQKASYVLGSKNGVCDEITNLFIAMVRAVGVPARFVSGISYTNSELFTEKWGPHGWAEVYFPGFGWVPFDITYGELGFIDPTHISTQKSIDSGKLLTEYYWESSPGVEIQSKDVQTTTSILEVVPYDKKFITIDVEIEYPQVGFESYNLIKAHVTNLRNHYFATELYLSKTSNVEILGEYRKAILLEPGESKTFWWMVQLEEVEPGYVYTFPTSVTSLIGVEDKTSFESKQDYERISKAEVEAIFGKATLVEKNVKEDLSLKCSSESEIYIDTDVEIECILKNLGNINFKDLKVCLSNVCKEIDLTISSEGAVNFITSAELGDQEFVVTANDLSETVYVYVSDKPKVEVYDVNAPESVKFGDYFKIKFNLSNSGGENVNVKVSDGKQVKNFEAESGVTIFTVDLYANRLKEGENYFSIFVDYKDKNGEEFGFSEKFAVVLEKLTFWQKIIKFFSNI
jgi:transglutaminase-like putative cysteine protease